MEKVNRNKGHVLSWLMDAIRGKRRYILLLTVIQMIQGGLTVGYALFLRGIIDSAVAGRRESLIRYSALLVGLVVLQLTLRCIFHYLDEYSRAVMDISVKRKIFSCLLTGDYASVSAVHSGEWLNRMSSDVGIVTGGLSRILPGFAGMMVKMITAVVALMAFDLRFGVLFVAGGGVLIVLTSFLRKKMKTIHRKMQMAEGDMKVCFTERLVSLLTIRAFGKEDMAMDQAMEKMEIHKSFRMKKNHISNVTHTGMGFAINGAYALGAIYCGSQILAGVMTYGAFTAILQLISQIQGPIASLSGYLPRYYSMIVSGERLMEVDQFAKDDLEPAVADMGGFYRGDFRGLQLRDVTFAYRKEAEAEVVLQDLDLTIQKGEYVAFTGPSGCGKSTVLKLLMSMYPLEKGTRAILTSDGEVPLTSRWRRLFAYVPQGNQLMNGTIREVVTFGDPKDMRREADIFRALKIACAEEFVRTLPDGLDTMLGERGSGLSEGQMQRIAIARAIFSDRPILLLDEATSALDEHTEKEVLKNLRAMTDQTVVIVTHRPAVLEVTDQEVRFKTK